MSSEDQVQSRRAIEALRSGVPNQDAVRALGGTQPVLEQKFLKQLQDVSAEFPLGNQADGMLIAGDFGSGKSHLLERFQHLALERNFVCSKIVVSKDTPLYDPAKLFRAAIESAMIPNRKGAAIYNVAAAIDFRSSGYADFFKWVNNSSLGSQFASTLYIYEYGKGGDEIRDRVLRFWSGDPISVTELRKCLREMGEAATYRIRTVPKKELALQRYLFVPRLIVAAGYSGWVLLIDEVELITHYSLKQRARSYAELARWIGRLEGYELPGLTSVLTVAGTFEAVLDERRDEERISAKFGDSGNESDELLASQAETGLRLIRTQKVLLDKPDERTLRDTFEKLSFIYSAAYGWEPPSDCVIDRTRVIRQHVKSWITEWDLRRLYPEYRPDIEIGSLAQDHAEQPDLESPDDDLPDDPESVTQ